MTAKLKREGRALLKQIRIVSDACRKTSDAEALFALKADVVEALEVCADFITLQRRVLEARPVAPSLQKLVCSRTAPVDPADGDTWGDFSTGKLMVAKDGEWLDPAHGIAPLWRPLASHDDAPIRTKVGPIEFALDRLAFVLFGFFAALAVLS